MTYPKAGQEYLTDDELVVWTAVGTLARKGRTVNNSQVAATLTMSRTSVAALAQTLSVRGFLEDTAPLKAAYHWRQTGKQPANLRDVHTEHCCSVHGCKYGDAGCTVASGQKKQSFPCEFCSGLLVWEMTDEAARVLEQALDEAIAWRNGHGKHPSGYGKVYAGPSEKFDDLLPFEQALSALHEVRRTQKGDLT